MEDVLEEMHAAISKDLVAWVTTRRRRAADRRRERHRRHHGRGGRWTDG